MTKEDLPPKCPDCKSTDDLAQCPECHLWFCRAHDRHECFPDRDAQFRRQIDVIRKRRKWAGTVLGCVLIGWGLGALDILMARADWGIVWEYRLFYLLYSAGLVALSVLCIIAYLHYDRRLRQLGGLKRSIRTETAKKDR